MRRIKSIAAGLYLIVASIGFAAVSGHEAHAAIITYNYSGLLDGITDASNLVGSTFSVGDSFAGKFSYRTTAPEGSTTTGDPTTAIYRAVIDFNAEINGYIFQSTGVVASGLQVWDGRVVGSNTVDAFTVNSPAIFGGPIDIGPGNVISGGGIKLFDFTNSANSNISIPSVVSLSDFNSRQFHVLELNRTTGQLFHLAGDVTSLTFVSSIPEPSDATPAPEPTSIALFTLGLLGTALVFRPKRMIPIRRI